MNAQQNAVGPAQILVFKIFLTPIVSRPVLYNVSNYTFFLEALRHSHP